MSIEMQLPMYQCNKKVWALKIEKIQYDENATDMDYAPAVITPADDRYKPFDVTHEYMKKHNPQVGGYFVIYKDGYLSYSPAEPFEDGYTLIEE